MLWHEVPWYYIGCTNCSRKLKVTYTIDDKLDGSGELEEKQLYQCNNERCKGASISAVPSYFRLQIQIRDQDFSDSPGVLSLTLFDRDCVKILKTTAKELIENTKEVPLLKHVPIAYAYLALRIRIGASF